jgi:hypothetical protein
MSDRDRIELAKILIENTYHSRREALESALKQLGQARENKANGVAGKCEEAVALALVGIAETQFVAAQSSWLKIQPTP